MSLHIDGIDTSTYQTIYKILRSKGYEQFPRQGTIYSELAWTAAEERAEQLNNQRLFNTSYVRSIDALLLASYRAAVLLQWLPWLSLLIGVMAVDTHLQRLIRAKEFRQHNPELFALYAGLGIITACAAALACVAPVSWHPLVMPLLPVLVGFWGSRAWGHYHRRGH